MRSDLLREAPTNRSQSPFLFTAKGQEGEGATFLFDNKWKSYPFVPNFQQNHESFKITGSIYSGKCYWEANQEISSVSSSAAC
jgi:hypothetical protein